MLTNCEQFFALFLKENVNIEVTQNTRSIPGRFQTIFPHNVMERGVLAEYSDPPTDGTTNSDPTGDLPIKQIDKHFAPGLAASKFLVNFPFELELV